MRRDEEESDGKNTGGLVSLHCCLQHGRGGCWPLGDGQPFASESLLPGTLMEGSNGSRLFQGVLSSADPFLDAICCLAPSYPSLAPIAIAGCTQSPPTHLSQSQASKMRLFKGEPGLEIPPCFPSCGPDSCFYPGSGHWTFYRTWGYTHSAVSSFIACVPVQSPCSWGSALLLQTSTKPVPKP